MNHCHSKRSSIEAQGGCRTGWAGLPAGMEGQGQGGGEQPLDAWLGRGWDVSVCPHSNLEATVECPGLAAHLRPPLGGS